MYHINYFIRTIISYIFRYLPWVIIGVLFCSFDVHAMNITPSTCVLYYSGGNKTGEVNQYNTNGQQWYGCQASGISNSLTGTRYYYTAINHGKQGIGLVTFSIQAQSKAQVTHAVFTTGGVDYSCSVSTGGQLTDTSDGLRTYYVACNNVVLVPSQNFFIRIYTTTNSIGQLGSYVQTGVNFYSSNEVGQIIVNQQQQTNNKLDQMNDNITSSDTDNNNVSNTLNNVSIGNEGVITQLITLPINLFTNVLNAINGQCTSFNLGNLFGTNLILPCINIENIVGSNLWSVIDILFSGFSIYFISNKVKKIFEQFTNLKEGDVLND